MRKYKTAFFILNALWASEAFCASSETPTTPAPEQPAATQPATNNTEAPKKSGAEQAPNEIKTDFDKTNILDIQAEAKAGNVRRGSS